MGKIAKRLTDLVGNTPLLELTHYNASKNLKVRLVVKLEYFNPAGSVKDRIALAMVEAAEAEGVLKLGASFVSSTLSRWLRTLVHWGERYRETESSQSIRFCLLILRPNRRSKHSLSEVVLVSSCSLFSFSTRIESDGESATLSRQVPKLVSISYEDSWVIRSLCRS